eukprot:COSAG01_NODE_183_length_22835_cov_17.169247_13_plen_666_part_00
MFKHLSRSIEVARCFGLANIPPRLMYVVKQKSGWLIRQTSPRFYSRSRFVRQVSQSTPQGKDLWKLKRKRFFPLLNSTELRQLVPAETWRSNVTAVCESALAGNYPYFNRWQGEIGWPPNFNLDPVNHLQYSQASHWKKATCDPPEREDIKLVWESSRLSLAFFFAREYRYSEEEKWADAFWKLCDAWIEQNPVNQTINWMCSQEVTFRLMALLWGTFSTLDSPAATPDRLASLHLLVWQIGKRIAATTEYAISQKNNHALSEAVGLWTIGLLFPEFKKSDRWKRKGRSILKRECQRQIYDDGSYVQQSFNYHRVMLDDLIWAIQLGYLNNDSLPVEVCRKFAAATQWLGHFVDESNGRVPNYGANDGANVLPLACTDYLDFRPTLRAAQTIAGLTPNLNSDRIVEEKSLWLTGLTPQNPVKPNIGSWSGSDGGYHILKSESSRLMIRCGNFRDRPGQADMLHVDLWYCGTNVLRDSGSYRYHHSDVELMKYFSSVEAHNTAQVDGYQQMTKGPGFLWLDWPKANLTSKRDADKHVLDCRAGFTGPANQYQYSHHRRITQRGDVFEIVDTIPSNLPFIVRWHLSPNNQWEETTPGRWTGVVENTPYMIAIHGFENVKQGASWESLYYNEKSKIPVLLASGKSKSITTTVGPKIQVVEFLDRIYKT